MTAVDVDRRPMRLTAAQWERVGYSRRRLLREGPPLSGRLAAGESAYVLAAELAGAEVPVEWARALVDEMPFSADSTPESVVRSRTLPYFFERGWAFGLGGGRVGCACTWTRPHGFAALLEPYCEGACFGRRRLEAWQVAVGASMMSSVDRDVYWFLCRHADPAGVFTCSASYVCRGLGFVHGFSTIRGAFRRITEARLVVTVKGESRVAGVPLRQLVRVDRAEVGGLVDVLDAGRVAASELGFVWCARGLGADHRDVYGQAASGGARDADAAARVLSWLSRRRVVHVVSGLQERGLLTAGRCWEARPAPPGLLEVGEAVAAGRRRGLVAEQERGRERRRGDGSGVSALSSVAA